jgi:hypothetical protein
MEALKAARRQAHAAHAALAKETTAKAARLAALRQRYHEVQLLKFGREVPRPVLDHLVDEALGGTPEQQKAAQLRAALKQQVAGRGGRQLVLWGLTMHARPNKGACIQHALKHDCPYWDLCRRWHTPVSGPP